MFCIYTRPRYQVSGYRTIGPGIYLRLLLSRDVSVCVEV